MVENIEGQFCDMAEYMNNHTQNTLQNLTDIKKALTWLKIRAKLNTDNSDAGDVGDKSRDDSKDDGYSTPSDSVDEPIEDKDPPFQGYIQTVLRRHPGTNINTREKITKLTPSIFQTPNRKMF